VPPPYGVAVIVTPTGRDQVLVPSPLAELVLRHRIVAGLSQQELARRSGLGELALDQLDPADHAGRGTAHLMLGSVATDRRETRRARAQMRAALVHARRATDLRLIGRVLNNLGTLYMELGRLADAERLLRAAAEAKRRSGAGAVDLGRTLFNLAETALDDCRLELAASRAAESVTLLRAGGHDRLAAFAATTRGVALLQLRDVDGALAMARQGIALLGESWDDRRAIAVIGLRCSVIWHAAGEPATAVETLRRVLPMALASTDRDREEVALVLELHSALLAPRAPVPAAQLLGAADAIRRGSIRPD
jgi:tetratricopeptide (TPR) repeat protein